MSRCDQSLDSDLDPLASVINDIGKRDINVTVSVVNTLKYRLYKASNITF